MTSRHPAVSCACPKCQSERRTTPTPAADANPFVGTNWQVRADTPATDTPGTYGTMTPTIEVVPPHYPLATEEREAVAQWCSGCHEVRSVDCYRAGCPKSDTERRAAEILAAEANERARDALQTLLNMAQPSICYLACEHGSTFEPSNPNIMHSDLCNELRAALTANHSAPVVEE